MKGKKKSMEFQTEYTVMNGLKKGDIYTKLSAVILGMGNFARKEIGKGILFLLSEIAFIAIMIGFGILSLVMLPSLGTKETGEVFNEATQVYEYVQGDNSMLILLYGIVTFFLIGFFVVIW